MTPEQQIETYKAIEESSAVMVVAELRLIRQSLHAISAVLACIAGILFTFVIFTARGNAAPIAPAIQEQPWYTMHVSTAGPDGPGVYAVEVTAPKLEGLFAQPQIVEIGDPPRLTDAPEPGTIWLVLAAMVAMVRRQANG